MSAASTPPWLERVVRAALGTEPQDTRLGDLSEQYARALERADGTRAAVSRVAAGLQYVGSAASVVLFARVVDPGLRLSEDGALGLMSLELREKVMNAMRRLAMSAILLACSAFLVFSAVAVWQDWRQNEAMVQTQQREKAEAIAQRVDAFIGDIQRQLGWVAQPQWAAQLPVDQKRFDYVRLLRQVLPITELAYVDAEGRQQLHVSRLSMDKIGEGTDRSSEPAVKEAKSGKIYFSPVHFRKESEPYLTMGVGHGRDGAVTVAALNLKMVWDSVARTTVGNTGYAYIVDGQGRLVAHPDVALVMRGTDMKGLTQVAAALAPSGNDAVAVGTNRKGAEVWSVQAPVKTLGWRVFVELPVAETRAAFWMAMGRAGGLLLLGVAAAWVAFRFGMRPAPPLRAASA